MYQPVVRLTQLSFLLTFLPHMPSLVCASVCCAETATLVHNVFMSAKFILLQLTLASSGNIRHTETCYDTYHRVLRVRGIRYDVFSLLFGIDLKRGLSLRGVDIN